MRWTDKKNEETVVGGGITGASAKLVQVNWPSKAGVNTKRPFSVLAEMENAKDVGYIGVGNVKGNPGNMIVTLDKDYKVPPGYAVIAQTQREVCAGCRFMLQGQVRFDKKGDYKIVVLAGVK